MAARENTGLQVALILFVMITVVMAIVTYMYYGVAEDGKKTIAQLTTEKDAEKAKAKKFENAWHLVRRMVGVPDPAKQDHDYEAAKTELAKEDVAHVVAQMEENFKKDMETYGVGLAPEELHYRTIPDKAFAAIREKNNQIADANDREQNLEAELAAAIAKAEDRVKIALTGQQKVSDDLASERVAFNTERARAEAMVKDFEAKRDEALKTNTTISDEFQGKEKVLRTAIGNLQENLETTKKALAKTRSDTPDRFDGKVTWVNQRAKLVWINLGSSDSLPRQATFAVYDQGETNAAKAKKKGSIEVVRIIEAHLAEARIVDDGIDDPIIPGDHIYSPAWQPGTKVRFALAGFMDIDGDGASDRQLIRNVIFTNGGEIDCELQDDGRIVGEVQLDTRYLVLGKRPTESSGKELVDGYSRITGEAARKSVESISVGKLLGIMGYKGEERTVTLGDNARSTDFAPAKKPAAGGTGAGAGAGAGAQPGGGDGFRERRPPARGQNGAF